MIELVIALVVVTLLISIAVPMYRDQERETQRNEAWRLLHRALQCTELRIATTQPGSRYSGSAPTILQMAQTCQPANTKTYQYDVSREQSSERWAIIARPLGDQRLDECGTLQLSSDGERQTNMGLADTALC